MVEGEEEVEKDQDMMVMLVNLVVIDPMKHTWLIS